MYSFWKLNKIYVYFWILYFYFYITLLQYVKVILQYSDESFQKWSYKEALENLKDFKVIWMEICHIVTIGCF